MQKLQKTLESYTHILGIKRYVAEKNVKLKGVKESLLEKKKKHTSKYESELISLLVKVGFGPTTLGNNLALSSIVERVCHLLTNNSTPRYIP